MSNTYSTVFCRSTPIRYAKVEARFYPIPRYHGPQPRRRVSVSEAVLEELAMTAERFEQIKNATYRGDRRRSIAGPIHYWPVGVAWLCRHRLRIRGGFLEVARFASLGLPDPGRAHAVNERARTTATPAVRE